MKTSTIGGFARLYPFAILVLLGPAAFGQGILFPERPEVRDQPFAVKNVRISTTISDGVAETTVEQTFVNHSPVDQEGTYVFPLPEGATVTSFTLRAGDRVLEARMLSREEARGIYESIVRRRRDPALLEYLGRGMFRSSVFPIPAHAERVLTLKYAEILKPEGGVRKYVYSLSTGRFSSRPVELTSIFVRIKTSTALKTIYSPSHDVSIRRNDDYSATASWEGRGEFSDRDFSLFYSTSGDEVGLSLLNYQSGDRDGYFVLIASPRFNIPKERILPKQIVFVLDRTGSMQANGKMEQAKSAMQFCLDNLHPQDRFDVITFNESADVLTRSLVAASPENVKRAHRFVSDVDASGGTNIDEALRSALGLLKDAEGTQKMIVFMTDGLPTVGETNVENILANVRRMNGIARFASAGRDYGRMAEALKARVFCFGVGYDVNVPFLDRLAEENRADADYVRPKESIESIVSAFYSKVSSPILANLQLAFDGAEVYDVYPKQLPDLFKGGQIVVTGRYRGDPRGGIKLTGYAQDRPASFRLERAFSESAARSGLIPRIWAARKIGYLLDEVRLHANQEVINEVVRLSKEHGIITPYTSYLADERQDLVLRDGSGQWQMPAGGATHYLYRLNEGALRQGNDDSVRQLNELSRRGRGEVGAEETHRALNSKGLKESGRAPTNAQGGFAGGRGAGLGGGGLGAFGPAGTELERSKLSLDYFGAYAGDKKSAMQNIPGYKQVQANARVQNVAGRTFYKRGNVWFDNGYPSGRKVFLVKNLSDAHFQLIHALPSLAKYAAVGDEVVIDLGKTAVQLGNQGKEKLTEAELREITGR